MLILTQFLPLLILLSGFSWCDDTKQIVWPLSDTSAVSVCSSSAPRHGLCRHVTTARVCLSGPVPALCLPVPAPCLPRACPASGPCLRHHRPATDVVCGGGGTGGEDTHTPPPHVCVRPSVCVRDTSVAVTRRRAGCERVWDRALTHGRSRYRRAHRVGGLRVTGGDGGDPW